MSKNSRNARLDVTAIAMLLQLGLLLQQSYRFNIFTMKIRWLKYKVCIFSVICKQLRNIKLHPMKELKFEDLTVFPKSHYLYHHSLPAVQLLTV